MNRVADRWARVDSAAGGLPLDLVLYAAGAIFAGLTGVYGTLAPHLAWGRVAVIGYAAATLVAGAQLVVRRRAGTLTAGARLAGTGARATLTAATFAATALVPIVIQAAQRAAGRVDRAQEEVGVVESGGLRLLHTGTPYLGHDAIAALPTGQRLDAYLPYQPGMALFGLPRAAGVAWWTDARVWFAVVLAAALVWAVLLVRRPDGSQDAALVRAVQAATVFPVCALTLATGGDDLPVLGLCLLALAFAARDRLTASGVTVGVAGALKLFAWPVALVLLAYAATRGRRVAGRYALGAVGLPVIALVPAFLVDRDAAVENVVRFPLGHGLVRSPAASPFPGHLIADHLPGGGAIATGLLVLAAVAIGFWLVRRPPRNAAEAAAVSASGLLAAILLIPSTRFGYLLYPVAYGCWAAALRPMPADVAALPTEAVAVPAERGAADEPLAPEAVARDPVVPEAGVG
ncbi:MAG TPA: glycosyltransferase family 87 protein [Micromonosporaceae bacterium]|nr:glycosyltransferase family 87 protein [Micromonosporaceae bacterium]